MRLAGGDTETGNQGGEAITAERVGGSSRESSDVGVEVVDTAGADVGDVHQRGAGQDVLAVAVDNKALLAETGRDSEDVGTSRGVEGLGVATRGDAQGGGRLEESDNVDIVVHGLVAVGNTLKVVAAVVVGGSASGGVGSIAVEGLQVTAVPVDNLLSLDVVGNVGVSILVGGNEGSRQVEETVVRHVVGPLGVAVVSVLGAQGSNVVRFTIVVPGNDLNHGETLLEDLLPSVEQESATREDKVLAVADLGAVVSREPGRNGSEIGLAAEPALVGSITLSNSHVGTGGGGLVVTVAVPAHPVQGTVDVGVGRLAGVEVGDEVDVGASSRAHGVDIEAITGEGRSENTTVDLELGGLVGVLGNQLTNLGSVTAGVVPVEVEGDEDLHAVVGGRLVSVVELGDGVVVSADVEGKGVDTGSLGSLHVAIVVGSASTVTNNANHEVAKDQAVTGGSTLLQRSDLDVGGGNSGGTAQRRQSCGGSKGAEAELAKGASDRQHCECVEEVGLRCD